MYNMLPTVLCVQVMVTGPNDLVKWDIHGSHEYLYYAILELPEQYPGTWSGDSKLKISPGRRSWQERNGASIRGNMIDRTSEPAVCVAPSELWQ